MLLVSAVLLLSIALRVHAAVFEYRVTSIVHRLPRLRLEEAPPSELPKLIPALRPCLKSDSLSPGDSCYEVHFASNLIWRAGPYGYKVAYWLGARYWDFSASVSIRQNKVRRVGYNVILNNGSLKEPWLTSVAVKSVRGYRSWYLDPTQDESPEYRVTKYFKWPDQSIQIVFTPNAPTSAVHHAFDINLNCIWYLRGCQTASELIPRADEDYQNIRRSAFARLRSPSPCPDRILLRRARDVADILLVEVENVHPTLEQFGDEQEEIADYRLLEVLKGKLDRPLKNVGHPLTISVGINESPIPNPALKLLHPGSQVLMFADASLNVDSPCETVEATENARRAIQLTLRSQAGQVLEERDLGQR